MPTSVPTASPGSDGGDIQHIVSPGTGTATPDQHNGVVDDCEHSHKLSIASRIRENPTAAAAAAAALQNQQIEKKKRGRPLDSRSPRPPLPQIPTLIHTPSYQHTNALSFRPINRPIDHAPNERKQKRNRVSQQPGDTVACEGVYTGNFGAALNFAGKTMLNTAHWLLRIAKEPDVGITNFSASALAKTHDFFCLTTE